MIAYSLIDLLFRGIEKLRLDDKVQTLHVVTCGAPMKGLRLGKDSAITAIPLLTYEWFQLSVLPSRQRLYYQSKMGTGVDY